MERGVGRGRLGTPPTSISYGSLGYQPLIGGGGVPDPLSAPLPPSRPRSSSSLCVRLRAGREASWGTPGRRAAVSPTVRQDCAWNIFARRAAVYPAWGPAPGSAPSFSRTTPVVQRAFHKSTKILPKFFPSVTGVHLNLPITIALPRRGTVCSQH